MGQKGFTGAPAITLEEADTYWTDLGPRWCMNDQYFKPYPFCRWAQTPVEGARSLIMQHGFCAKNIRKIEADKFH